MSVLKGITARAAVWRAAAVSVLGLCGLSACASAPADPNWAAPNRAAWQGSAPPSGYTPPLARPAFATKPAPSRNTGIASAPVSPAASAGRYKVGAPYQTQGVWYVPAEQPNYDEQGLASWYGDAFDGKPTANGETFAMQGVSAAHATLPMPSLVEVTNLENGRSLVVRLNDRGPFHPGRIIDLSRGGAERLGFLAKGTARVRVRYVGPAPLTGMGAPLTLASNAMASNAMAGASLDGPRPTRRGVVYDPPPLPVTFRPADTTGAYPAPGVNPQKGPLMAGGRFTIQAGAFAERARAETLAARLAAAGSTRITPLDRGGVRLYRVTLGSWSDAGAARATLQRLADMGVPEARISPAA